jgi:hypothetical protein
VRATALDSPGPGTPTPRFGADYQAFMLGSPSRNLFATSPAVRPKPRLYDEVPSFGASASASASAASACADAAASVPPPLTALIPPPTTTLTTPEPPPPAAIAATVLAAAAPAAPAAAGPMARARAALEVREEDVAKDAAEAAICAKRIADQAMVKAREDAQALIATAEAHVAKIRAEAEAMMAAALTQAQELHQSLAELPQPQASSAALLASGAVAAAPIGAAEAAAVAVAALAINVSLEEPGCLPSLVEIDLEQGQPGLQGFQGGHGQEAAAAEVFFEDLAAEIPDITTIAERFITAKLESARSHQRMADATAESLNLHLAALKGEYYEIHQEHQAMMECGNEKQRDIATAKLQEADAKLSEASKTSKRADHEHISVQQEVSRLTLALQQAKTEAAAAKAATTASIPKPSVVAMLHASSVVAMEEAAAAAASGDVDVGVAEGGGGGGGGGGRAHGWAGRGRFGKGKGRGGAAKAKTGAKAKAKP